MIPAASAFGEDLGFLTHHRIFACLSGNCGSKEITPEKKRTNKEEKMTGQSHVEERNRPTAAFF